MRDPLKQYLSECNKCHKSFVWYPKDIVVDFTNQNKVMVPCSHCYKLNTFLIEE